MVVRHSEILIKPVDCDGELEFVDSDFSCDVLWVVYQCKKCEKKIATVQGGKHWWNFEIQP